MNRKLRQAVRALDEATIRRLAPNAVPDDPVSFWRGVHKAREADLVATDEQRAESRAWLAANGSRPLYALYVASTKEPKP